MASYYADNTVQSCLFRMVTAHLNILHDYCGQKKSEFVFRGFFKNRFFGN